IQRDAAERLEPGIVLAGQPGPIRGQRDMVLEHHRLDLAREVELGHLVVVDRAAEDVGRAVVVKVDEALDRTDGGWWRGKDADLGPCGVLERGHRGEAHGASGGRPEELAPARSVSLGRGHDLGLSRPVVAAAVGEAPARDLKWPHGRTSFRAASALLVPGAWPQ